VPPRVLEPNLAQDLPSPERSRYFTPAEATALLPTLAPRLTQVDALAAAHRAMRAELRRQGIRADQREALNQDALHTRDQARQILEEIALLGVEVIGIQPSRVHFPALLRGNPVWLCWRAGEEQVAWWQAPGDGSSARRPVRDPDDGSWEWWH